MSHDKRGIGYAMVAWWVMALMTTAGADTPPLALRVTPSSCQAPCTVMLRVRVPAHADNRWLVVQLDGSVFRGSAWQLHGIAAPIQQPDVAFADIPAGRYEILAVLYRNTKEFTRVRSSVVVVGRE